MQTIQIAGMAWFHADDYEQFRRVLPERSWHATHALWLAAAEQNVQRLEKQGIRAIKAHIHSDDFVAWCRARGRDIDTQALVAMANELAARELGYGQPKQ